MNRLLARHAECLFWMGRYIERSASLARILMVQTAFDRGRVEGTGWAWVLTLYDQSSAFAERYDDTSSDTVIAFCLKDTSHIGSIMSSLSAARDNARALRALVATDFWVQINRLYKRARELPPSACSEKRLAHTCEEIQQDCHALLGLAEATFYRDAGWRLFRLGVEIERADQMSRLLDVRFAQLQTGTADRGELLGDFAFWSLLLRSCGGHHAYRRMVSGPLTPESVARFLIFDQSFARSIGHCANAVDRRVVELRTQCALRTPAPLLQATSELIDTVHTAASDPRLINNLHAFNDHIQLTLGDIAGELATAYFPRIDDLPEIAPASTASGSTGSGAGRSHTQSESQSSGQSQSQSQPPG